MEFENYSRRALLWFAAFVDLVGWLLVIAVSWAICLLIEWWTA